MLKVYGFDSYKDLLRSFISAKREADPTFSQAQLADQMRVQKSYLSRVLNDDAHLNSDQLYLLAHELNLSLEERNYLLLLLEIDRCGLEVRKNELIRQREKIKKDHLQSSKALGRAPLQPNSQAFVEYYSDWTIPLVHMYLTIPKYLTDPTLISEHLGLSLSQLRTALGVLERCQILALEKKKYHLQTVNLHLDPESPLFKIYATQFRLLSIQHLQQGPKNENYFFTASFSANEQVRLELKSRFLDLLKWLSKEVEKEKATQVYHLNFDLFKT